jgi:hypothetical protein
MGMAHEIVRTINGRQYRYLEESYRVPGVRTPRKRSTYLGPVDPVYAGGERKRKKGIFGVIDDLVRKKRDWNREIEPPAQERERISSENRERERTDRNNDLLTGESISLAELAEVASSQKGVGSSSDGAGSEGLDAGDAGKT